MKSCPTCNRTFEDTLTYCLVDGSILSAPFDPQATVIIPDARKTEPPPTEVLHNPPSLPLPETNPSKPRSKRLWLRLALFIIVSSILSVYLVGGGSYLLSYQLIFRPVHPTDIFYAPSGTNLDELTQASDNLYNQAHRKAKIVGIIAGSMAEIVSLILITRWWRRRKLSET